MPSRLAGPCPLVAAARRVCLALPHPQRDQAGHECDEEHLADQRLERDERLREADGGREIAEAERRQRDEAEVDVFRLLVRPRLHEERLITELAQREVHEREEQPYED